MKVGIVGLGLIGGSLGLAIKQAQAHPATQPTIANLPWTVLGVSRRAETCQHAVSQGVVDEADVDARLLTAADLIVFCTPPGTIAPMVEKLKPQLQADTVLTDVSSIKASIVAAISSHWPNFVGGHPMAGGSESGLSAAQASLFEGRPYVLTPTASTPPEALARVEALVRCLKAKLYYCDPVAHDRAVAWISHLPVFVSASLIAACGTEPDKTVQSLAQAFASSGFRDTSRVGGGPPELGLMMAEANRSALLPALYAYREQMDQFIQWIETQNWTAIALALHQTQQARPTFLSDRDR